MNAVNPVQSSVASGDHPPAAEPSMEEILASIRRIIADDQSFPGRPPTDLAPSVEIPHESPPTDLAPSVEVPHEPPPIAPEPDAPPASSAPEPHPAPAPAEPVTADEAMPVLHEPIPEELPQHEVPHVPATEAVDAATPEHDVHAPQIPSPEEPSIEVPSIMPEVAGVGSVAEELEAALAETIQPEPVQLEPIPPELEPSHAPFDPPPAMEAVVPPDNLFSPAIDSSITMAFNTLAASRLVASTEELKGLVGEMIRPLLKAWIDDHLPHVVERLLLAEIERIARGGI